MTISKIDPSSLEDKVKTYFIEDKVLEISEWVRKGPQLWRRDVLPRENSSSLDHILMLFEINYKENMDIYELGEAEKLICGRCYFNGTYAEFKGQYKCEFSSGDELYCDTVCPKCGYWNFPRSA